MPPEFDRAFQLAAGAYDVLRQRFVTEGFADVLGPWRPGTWVEAARMRGQFLYTGTDSDSERQVDDAVASPGLDLTDEEARRLEAMRPASAVLVSRRAHVVWRCDGWRCPGPASSS